MKRVALFFVLLLAIACSSAFGKVIVRGKIIGYDGKSKVFYCPTLEGIFAPYQLQVSPAEDGTFRIEYENPGYGNLVVGYNGMTFRFFHAAGSKIYFEVREVSGRPKRKIAQQDLFTYNDSLKQAQTVKITGDYSEINQFYNRNLRSSYFTTNMLHGHFYSLLIYNAIAPTSALTRLDSLTQIELSQVDNLPDADIHDFLKNEVRSFYTGVFLNGMYLKRVDQIKAIMQDSTADRNIYNRDWEVLVEQMRQRFDRLSATPNSADYADLIEGMVMGMSDYKKYEFSRPDKSTLDSWVKSRLISYDTTILKDPKSRYRYELYGMKIFLENQMMYSPVLLKALTGLQRAHRGSAHLEFFEPKIEALKLYLQKSSSADVISEHYDTFSGLMKRFEGKNVFIDIWATWCGPCIEEFNHKSVAESFADRNEIAILYISIDKPMVEDRWKQAIAANDLKGSHFRADKEFINDMWETIGGSRGVIPRYLLIDKQGKIFNSNAALPSNANELARQIKSLISQ